MQVNAVNTSQIFALYVVLFIFPLNRIYRRHLLVSLYLMCAIKYSYTLNACFYTLEVKSESILCHTVAENV